LTYLQPLALNAFVLLGRLAVNKFR